MPASPLLGWEAGPAGTRVDRPGAWVLDGELERAP